MIRILLFTILLASGNAYSCGESDEFPHEILWRKGESFTLGKCALIKIAIPTQYQRGVVSYVFLTYDSPNTKNSALEAALNFVESPVTENETEIDFCVNEEIAATMTVEIYYKNIPNDEGGISMCGPQRYKIDDFLSHLQSS